jgi:hypothetical protein
VQALVAMFDLWKQGFLPVPDDSFIEQFDRNNLTKKLAREISLVAKY